MHTMYHVFIGARVLWLNVSRVMFLNDDINIYHVSKITDFISQSKIIVIAMKFRFKVFFFFVTSSAFALFVAMVKTDCRVG